MSENAAEWRERFPGEIWPLLIGKNPDAVMAVLRAMDDTRHPPPVRLPSFSLADIAADVKGLRREWLIKRLWLRGSFGMVAGPEKTLKSYVTELLALSIASGKSITEVWEVGDPAAVLVFAGESGRNLWLERARYIGSILDLSPEQVDALPIRVVDDIAPLHSDRFTRTVTEELDARKDTALVLIDPLYSYYGAERGAGASNVYDAGELLASISKVTVPRDVALMIVNHFNKAAAGRDLSLSSITQAGSREWSETWMLLGHKEKPDLAAGLFQLNAAVGSRRGYGGEYVLEFNLGKFDWDAIAHVGTPSFTVREPNDSGEAALPLGLRADVLVSVWKHLAVNKDNPVSETTGVTRNRDLAGTQGDREKALKYLRQHNLIREVTVPTTDRQGRARSYVGLKPTMDLSDEAILNQWR